MKYLKSLILSLSILFLFNNAFAQIKVVAPDGDVGVDVATPSAKLDINGAIKVADLVNDNVASDGVIRYNGTDFEGYMGGAWNSLTSGGGAATPWTTSGNDVYYSGGAVGIGIAAPERVLHMRASNASLRIDRQSNAPGFILVRWNGAYTNALNSYSVTTPYTSSLGGYFSISDNDGAVVGSGDRRLIIADNGDVSIGSNLSPTQKLHVEGDAYKTSGGTQWSSSSDKRLKKNILRSDYGLEDIMKLNPVSYEYNGLSGTVDGEFHVGVIAQELKEVFPHMVSEYDYYTDDGQEIENVEAQRTFENTYYAVNPSDLQWILVSAMKEQQALIDEKDEQIDELSERLAQLEQAVNTLLEKGTGSSNQSNVTLTQYDLASLEQNRPNPFSGDTKIDYVIPSNAKSSNMRILSPEGKLIKTVEIDHVGEGTLTVSVEDIPSGNYTYQLVVDGFVVETKKMLLSK